MKKLFTALALSLSLALSLGVAACSGTENGGTSGKFEQLNTAESVYGFSAASAGMLVSSMNGGEASAFAAALAAGTEQTAPETGTEQTAPETGSEQTAPETGTEQTAPATGSEQTTPETSEPASELDGYMALVESLLSDGGFTVEETASDRAGYETKMVVSYRDLHGNTLQYELHYNRIEYAGNGGGYGDYEDHDDYGDHDRDRDRDRDRDDRREDETEEEYGLEGVMVIDGTDYAVRGERETETEGNESESETTFRVELGEGKYILVEQSHESEGVETEQEYSYSVFENGRLSERSTFEYESERGETEIKMTYRKGSENSVFYFERETVRGEEVIRLRVGSGNASQSWYVQVSQDAEGRPHYEYVPAGR